MSGGRMTSGNVIGSGDRRLPGELVVFVWLLFAVPARFAVPGFGAAGAPADLLGLAMLALLVLERLHGSTPMFRRAPMDIALVAYLAMLITSYAYGRSQVLSTLQSTTSDRLMISTFSLAGLYLFVRMSVTTRDQVLRLVDLVLKASLVMVIVGCFQFFLRFDLTSVVRPPGLVDISILDVSIDQRSVFNRPFGTALHPIEFGVVASALAPLAAMRATQTKSMLLTGVTILLTFGALLSLSRSAVLALAVGSLVLAVGLKWRDRINLALGGVVLVVAAGSLVPGLVGTISKLITGAGSDPSVLARVNRTPEVLRLIAENPWVGSGYGTFNTDEFLLLDNEIQKLAIETGVIGIALLLGIMVTALWTVVDLHRNGTRGDAQLAIALLATCSALFVSSYTFDAFFYHILRALFYICLALIGTLRQLSPGGTSVATSEVAGRPLDRAT